MRPSPYRARLLLWPAAWPWAHGTKEDVVARDGYGRGGLWARLHPTPLLFRPHAPLTPLGGTTASRLPEFHLAAQQRQQSTSAKPSCNPTHDVTAAYSTLLFFRIPYLINVSFFQKIKIKHQSSCATPPKACIFIAQTEPPRACIPGWSNSSRIDYSWSWTPRSCRSAIRVGHEVPIRASTIELQ
jgi:hypothetical protein